jgi:hypothetical protein
METTMTAIIVAAQGHGITDRAKTGMCASTAVKSRPGRRQRMISRRCAPVDTRSTKDPRSPFRNPMSGTVETLASIGLAGERERDNSFILIWSCRNGD